MPNGKPTDSLKIIELRVCDEDSPLKKPQVQEESESLGVNARDQQVSELKQRESSAKSSRIAVTKMLNKSDQKSKQTNKIRVKKIPSNTIIFVDNGSKDGSA